MHACVPVLGAVCPVRPVAPDGGRHQRRRAFTARPAVVVALREDSARLLRGVHATTQQLLALIPREAPRLEPLDRGLACVRHQRPITPIVVTLRYGPGQESNPRACARKKKAVYYVVYTV